MRDTGCVLRPLGHSTEPASRASAHTGPTRPPFHLPRLHLRRPRCAQCTWPPLASSHPSDLQQVWADTLCLPLQEQLDTLHRALHESRRHSRGLAQRSRRLEEQVASLEPRCQEAKSAQGPLWQVRPPEGRALHPFTESAPEHEQRSRCSDTIQCPADRAEIRGGRAHAGIPWSRTTRERGPCSLCLPRYFRGSSSGSRDWGHRACRGTSCRDTRPLNTSRAPTYKGSSWCGMNASHWYGL